MQSRLVLKKQQFEMELKRGVRDQRRKQYSADEKKLSKAYYVPLASWTSSTDKKE